MEIQTHRNPHLSAPRSGSLPAELVHLSLIKTYKILRAGKCPLTVLDQVSGVRP